MREHPERRGAGRERRCMCVGIGVCFITCNTQLVSRGLALMNPGSTAYKNIDSLQRLPAQRRRSSPTPPTHQPRTTLCKRLSSSLAAMASTWGRVTNSCVMARENGAETLPYVQVVSFVVVFFLLLFSYITCCQVEGIPF